MRILALDDNELVISKPERYLVDAHDYTQDEIVQVTLPSLFWQQYDHHGPWDEIWLDHDLGSTSPHLSGKAITKKFDELAHTTDRDLIGLFVITTNNPATQRQMAGDLLNANLRVVSRPMSSLRDFGISRGFAMRGTRVHKPRR